MRPTLGGPAAALALLLGAGPGSAAPLSALIGLDAAAVRSRLADVPAGWPLQPAFRIATPEGELSFVTLYDLMMDPAAARLLAVSRTQGDALPPEPFLDCRETMASGGAAPEPAASTVLVFQDGRLESAFRPIERTLPPPPNLSDRKAMEAWTRRPRTSPFLASQGELPLEDRLGFLARIGKTELAPSDEVSASCAPRPVPRLQSPPRSHASLDASDWQGLALLPFAVTLPGKNAQRNEARRNGAAVLAALRLGEPLGAAPQAFAKAHKGVRLYSASQGDYVVMSIDLGGYPGRNLTNFNDAALVGVRSGRVEWISPPANFGPRPELLCLDAHGVPSAPRAGCSSWGHFSP